MYDLIYRKLYNLVYQSQAGISISEQMYNDLLDWYTYLESNIKDDMTLEEKGSVLYNMHLEVRENYPELRQIPFPTAEIGNNIAIAMDILRPWNEYPYFIDEANHIFIDNTITVLGQLVEIIARQLEEVKNI